MDNSTVCEEGSSGGMDTSTPTQFHCQVNMISDLLGVFNFLVFQPVDLEVSCYICSYDQLINNMFGHVTKFHH